MNRKNDGSLRINAFIGRSGYCSRRKADLLIRDRKVRVNGNLVLDLSLRVTQQDHVYVENKRIVLREAHSYLLLNKPPGYLCSHRSQAAKPTIYSLLPSILGLSSCGRLDFLTAGLIILSTDGNFIHSVSHPKTRIEKEYIVTALYHIAESTIAHLQAGKLSTKLQYSIRSVKRISSKKISVILIEGKNREIRNICKANKIGLQSIHRVRIGDITASSLPIGAWRNLSREEQEQLCNAHLY